MSFLNINDLTAGQLVASPRGELLKVHSVQYKRLKAQIVYPLQKQTSFREFGEEMVSRMREPSPELIQKYEEAVEKRRSKSKKKS